MKKSLLRHVMALVGLGSVAAVANPAPVMIPKERYRNQPPPPPQLPRPVEDLFYVPHTVKGWEASPPRNQRKIRKARRRAHAAGKRNAFAR